MNHDAKRSRGAMLRMALAGAVSLAAGAAQVAPISYCVSTPSEFQAALDDVADDGTNNGADAIIGVVAGMYAVSSTLTYTNLAMTGTLDIEGGYDAGCATRTGDALLTVLDGGGTKRVMFIENANADTSVSGLTFQNGSKTGAPAGGLYINGAARDVAATTIVNNVFRNNQSDSYAGALAATTNGDGKVILVRGNVFYGNNAASAVGAVLLIANGGQAQVYGNTVARNTIDNSNTGGLDCRGDGNCELANNILWDNDNSDLNLTSSTASLDFNDIGTRTGGTVPTEDVGNLAVDPRFVDADNGDFHLAGDSPLLAASPLPLGVLDVEGHSYPVAGAQDLGAFAETIFSGVFDPLVQ
jgi:hypothetical protein